MITKKDKETYRKCLKSLYNYMVKIGYTSEKKPTVILDDTYDPHIFIKTGYYDPQTKAIRLFTNGRHIKDVLRTFAHELVHWRQMNRGEIDKSGYKGDKIIDDKPLLKLESQAFLLGNLGFRRWTETMERKHGKI